MARQLRQDSFSKNYDLDEKMKKNAFEAAWKEYISGVQDKFDRKSASNHIFRQVRDLYLSELKEIRMGEASPITMDLEIEFSEYSTIVQKVIIK